MAVAPLRGPRLPNVVFLRCGVWTAAADVRAAFGASKQTLRNWRALYGFPAFTVKQGSGNITLSCELADWAVRHGARIEWV